MPCWSANGPSAADRAGKDGLRKAFGVMSKRVYDWAREPWGAPVGAAFADYAAGCADLATTSHTLRRYAPGAEVRHLHLSLGEAQRLLGVAPMVMQAIAERRDMYVMPPRGSGTPALLRADLVRELQEEMGDSILPEPARALVGTGRKVFDQLEAAGLFRRVPIKERLMPSRPYRGQDIRAFVTACLGKSPMMTRDAANRAGLTPLTRATNAHRSAADICRALVSGSPAACGMRPREPRSGTAAVSFTRCRKAAALREVDVVDRRGCRRTGDCVSFPSCLVASGLVEDPQIRLRRRARATLEPRRFGAIPDRVCHWRRPGGPGLHKKGTTGCPVIS